VGNTEKATTTLLLAKKIDPHNEQVQKQTGKNYQHVGFPSRKKIINPLFFPVFTKTRIYNIIILILKLSPLSSFGRAAPW